MNVKVCYKHNFLIQATVFHFWALECKKKIKSCSSSRGTFAILVSFVDLYSLNLAFKNMIWLALVRC